MNTSRSTPDKKIYKNHILKVVRYKQETFRLEEVFRGDLDDAWEEGWNTWEVINTSTTSSYQPICRYSSNPKYGRVRGWIPDGYKICYARHSHCGNLFKQIVRVKDIGRKWSSICKRCLLVYHKNKYNVNFFAKSRDTQVVLNCYNQIMGESFRF